MYFNFQKTNYDELVTFCNEDPKIDLQKKIDSFKPDVIFWSAISSHIHSEGEYVNIQNGYDLIMDFLNMFNFIAGVKE